MLSATNRTDNPIRRRYGTEADVETITGISRRTLQKDRLLGRRRFPWYRSGRRVLYDLDEVDSIIRSTVRGGACHGELPVKLLSAPLDDHLEAEAR